MRRIDPPVNCCTTDHAEEITRLREIADGLSAAHKGERPDVALLVLTYKVAADLLEAHDDTGISLDNWSTARGLVETLVGKIILDNGV